VQPISGELMEPLPTVSKSHTFLYSHEFDFPFYEGSPVSSIGLLFAPRSGSTLLGCLMRQSFALGFPLEYFAAPNVSILAERVEKYSLGNVSGLYRIRTSPNGVFSFKWKVADGCHYKYSVLLDKLNPKRYIVMDREDKDAQARSFAIAKRTREWVLRRGSRGAEEAPKVLDEEIRRAKEEIEAEWNFIRIFCKKVSVPIMYVTYEQVLQDPENVVREVVDFCNVQTFEKIDITRVPIARQS